MARKNPYRWFAIPGITLLILSFGGSLLWNFYYSLTRYSGYGHPIWVGARNYIFLWRNDEVRRALTHAIFFIVPFSILPIIIGSFLAAVIFDYIAPRFGDEISSFFRSLLYLPQIIPLAIVGVISHWFWNADTGAINKLLESMGLERFAQDWENSPGAMQIILSLILVWLQVGFTFVIFIAGMSRIDQTVLEAAQIDGASWFKQYRLITLPLLRPEMTVVFLTTLIGALKIFAPVYWITGGGPYGATNVPSIYVFKQFYGGNQVGMASSISMIMAVFLGAIALVILRRQREMQGAQ